MAAVGAALERAGAAAGDVVAFAHGMTVATNALLEGRGARTVLVATEGFTDVVELGRQARADLYRLCAARPAPLVPPERRVAAPERCGPDGVLRALDDDRRRARRARSRRSSPRRSRSSCCTPTRTPRTSWRSARRCADALPGVHVSLSHDVVGTFREYERAATTEIDAALSPLLARYLRPAARARRRGRPARAADHAVQRRPGGGRAGRARTPRYTVLSGPAGGAAAAALVARRSRAARTSSASTWAARRATSASSRAAPCARPPAARSAAGRSRWRWSTSTPSAPAAARSPGAIPAARCASGPRSAGAVPGPACYGRGGEEPTVTDANLLLGRLGTDAPLAGGVALDRGAARARGRRARRRARPGPAGLRGGNRARRQRRDGARAARHDRRAGHRPAPLRAAGVRRRRAAARRGDRRRARDDDDPLPARVGRAERARARRRRPPRERAAHGAAGRRRADRRGAGRRRATSWPARRARRWTRRRRRDGDGDGEPRSRSRSPTTCATAARRTS